MELECPHCHTTFQVKEEYYSSIIAQVRNQEFNSEIKRRMEELRKEIITTEKAKSIEAERRTDRLLAEKEREKSSLEIQLESMKTRLANFEELKRAEIAEAASRKDSEIADIRQQMELMKSQHRFELMKEKNAVQDSINAKDLKIAELKSELDASAIATEKQLLEIRQQNEIMLRAKDEEIERYRDLKSRLSTKLLGETLEQHCLNMFNRARSQGQFLTAYFEKDNDAAAGETKGDFIFRDYLDGEEYISIMFEMKNEDENTIVKHRNEHFFEKLNRDRCRKNCEYAVLVSTLEANNELYNEGIVDVSYRYEKMFVIRPQFFMSLITMLSRSAMRGAQNLISLRQQLAVAQAQTIDVTNFEKRRDAFVDEFGKLVNSHLKKQDEAIEALDKAIAAAEKQAENLRKIKAAFEASGSKLKRANEKAETEFTIKKLVYGNPTMRAKFDEARRLAQSDSN